MFMFDIETLAVHSDAVVLSAAMIYWDAEEDFTYNDLIDRAIFVKFDAKEQIKVYNRVVDKDTLQWWSKQGDFQRKISLDKSEDDVSTVDGVNAINAYYKMHTKEREPMVWARGNMDGIVYESLAKVAGIELNHHYGQWRDVRTAVDILYASSKNGYCDVDKVGFNRYDVIKHHPVHDCALDIMMMRYGI